MEHERLATVLELDGLLIGRRPNGELVFFQDTGKLSDDRLTDILGTLGLEDMEVEPWRAVKAAHCADTSSRAPRTPTFLRPQTLPYASAQPRRMYGQTPQAKTSRPLDWSPED